MDSVRGSTTQRPARGRSFFGVRRVLAWIPVLLALLTLLAAGFVWWTLQPRPDPTPLPSTLVAATQPEGRALLASAEASADHGPLLRAFESQRLRSYCGVASSVAVLKALEVPVSQEGFFDDAASRVRARWKVTLMGMSLAHLAGLLEAHGAVVSVHDGARLNLAGLRSVLQRNLTQAGDYVLVNYERGALGQPPGGHISPLAAYHRQTDRALILDTATYRYPATWVPLSSLLTAVQARDPDSGRARGLVEVHRAVAPGARASAEPAR